MSLADNRSLTFSNSPGSRDFWEKQYARLSHNQGSNSELHQRYINKLQTMPDKDFTQPLSPLRKGSFGKLSPGAERLADRDALASIAFSGDKVIARAQASLAIAGYKLEDNKRFGVTGKADHYTTQALSEFQKAVGLEPTGKPDLETMKALDLVTQKGLTKKEIEAFGKQTALEVAKQLSLEKQQRLIQRDQLVQSEWKGKGNFDIATAQASLRLAGYDLGPYGIDGIPGTYTKAATLQFQKDRGLNPNGILDSETITALNNATTEGWARPMIKAKPEPKIETAKPKAEYKITIDKESLPKYTVSYERFVAMKRQSEIDGYAKGAPLDPVRLTQERLKTMGFNIGPSGADGLLGQNTRNAIAAFQQTFGLPVTGELNRETITRIESEYAKGARVKEIKASKITQSQDIQLSITQNQHSITHDFKCKWVKINGIKVFRGTCPVVIRSDVADSFSNAVKEINELGGMVVSGGGMRPLNMGGKKSQSQTSLHYFGVAVDLSVGHGMQNPNKDPYVIVREGGTETNPKWRVYCRTTNESVEPLTLEAVIWKKDVGIVTQKVTDRFIDITAVMKKNGWEPISARKDWKSDYLCCEWWHFQKIDTIPEKATFGSELLKVYDQKEINKYFINERAKYLNYVWQNGVFNGNTQKGK
ncbi:MAG TPA: peptidoglycan-binding domain-containing protein [Bacillota bacterium]|nr:peptidoglycan-binding domain-containing protein [Bacillota bacterium]